MLDYDFMKPSTQCCRPAAYVYIGKFADSSGPLRRAGTSWRRSCASVAWAGRYHLPIRESAYILYALTLDCMKPLVGAIQPLKSVRREPASSEVYPAGLGEADTVGKRLHLTGTAGAWQNPRLADLACYSMKVSPVLAYLEKSWEEGQH